MPTQALTPHALQACDRFSLLPRAPFHASLAVDRHDTGLLLDGTDLQAAYAWRGLYLLLVHDGNHFEDALHCHLLSSALQPLDHAAIGGLYSTGDLQHLHVGAADALDFTYPTPDHAWRLTLWSRPGWRMPVLSDPIGVRRSNAFSRHFVLQRVARPVS